jgi:glutathione peroxidase
MKQSRGFYLIGLLVFLFSISDVRCEPTDHDEHCQEWADIGECEANPDYMLAYCAKSCAEVQVDKNDTNYQGSFFDLDALDIDENLVSFAELQGKITLIVNVASYCGYTESHYAGLVDLYDDLKDSGAFEILAFPCNQFGAQEPDSCSEIKRFAQEKGVNFRMMNKIDVNGPNTHKVYQYLKTVTGLRRITWNFATYFLVSPDGEVQAYSGSEPYDLREVIVDLMNEEL